MSETKPEQLSIMGGVHVEPPKPVTVERQVIMEADGQSIQHRFEGFHKAHPEVYNHFKRFAFEVINRKRKIGAKGIMERVRWEVSIVRDAGEEFKINNTYTSRYARMFREEFPGRSSFFATRRLLGD